MIIVMGVTIFTSRIILQSLGIENYGVMNVVGGIAFSFGFFSSSMTNATQRYLSFGHGKGDIAKVKDYFNIISILFFLGSGLILIIGGGLGFWIVKNLNIPSHLYGAGLVVYYATLISLIITLLASVYDSVLIAREDMSVYAYLSIIEAGFKLGIAYLIFLTGSHKLEIYALLLLSVTIIVKGSLVLYCRKKYKECRYNLIWDGAQIKDIFSFMGWNGLGTIVWVVNEQGINILINLFFGPVVNAARGVASQVNQAINNFTNNFFLALNPQIIKRYAADDIEGTIRITENASIFSYYLLWMICLPVILRRDYILSLWLKDVPEYTSIFLLWILIYSLVNVLTRPQWTVVQAVGQLKNYIINGCVTMIGAIPIGYLVYRMGSVPQTIFVIMVVLRLLYVFVSLHTIKGMIQLNICRYLKRVILPILIVSSLSWVAMSYLDTLFVEDFIGFILSTCTSLVVCCLLIFISLTSDTRQYILGIIRRRL
ncbi:hypothetical protein EEL33_20415 [Muribaculaceae bacterium Isolate-037 (Harlan)]|nr:hypothetical protein EEL33_20415 [Muribaculaceae bacterium Isolate-037 (Harlan)]